ncbi:hypothetical protein DUI87_34540 [Hirundo rustica rustica]|uniref:Uncharacterized protein n=1 Tax=Hirundo rustica rustica TaxID=333673 RepID=A0A3M0IL46_HIRRU|nr:hypothetical protein DUI87_34540 [Hirundo rustica rustica]
MQQEEKEEEEREEEEGWRSSRKRRRSSERRHHVHPSLSGSAAPWRRQHRPHRIPQRFARAAGSKNNIQKWGNEFGEVSEQDDVEIVVANIVNPASFLSGSTGEPVIHECLETIEATYSSRQDLKDTPLEDAETCLLMEAAMSSVEEDMLGMQLPQARRLKIEGCVIRGSDIDFNITQGCTEFHKNQTKITPPVPRKAVITQIPTIPEVEEQVTPVVSKIKP